MILFDALMSECVLMLSPLPRAGEGGPSGPGEGLLLLNASNIKSPSLPAIGGTLSRTRERGQHGAFESLK